MATIKSYTDLSQSKALAKILPLESADMYYDDIVDRVTGELFIPNDGSTIKVGKGLCGTINAWSLSALLDIIGCKFKYDFTYNGKSFVLTVGDFENLNKNLIDACVTMIEKLHELKML